MFPAAALKQLLAAAAAAGILAGVVLTLVQQFTVVPLLLEAEALEHAAAGAPSQAPAIARDTTVHPAHAAPEHLQRSLLSAAANVTLAVGLAALLAAAMFLAAADLGWRSGLLWGAAAYLVFFVAPSLGLPPELPGTEAAGLGQRQAWWLLAAACTAGGLGLLIQARALPLRIVGIAVLAIPHLLGAPQPAVHGGTAPAHLLYAFTIATAGVNLIFWLLLGSILGYLLKTLVAKADPSV